MINTNPTGRDTTEVAVQRLSQKLITKLNLQNSSRVFEDDSNNISAHDSVPRALSKLNAAFTAFDLSNRQDAEPIDASKSYSEGEIVYAEGASWRVAAGGANAGDLPSTHPDKFVSFQEGVTSIANKEAAYALTGVAVGTVYKTEDTGQILERAAKLDLAADFVIVGNAAGMMGVTLAGTYSADTVGQNSPPSSDVGYLGFYCNENSGGNNMSVTYESGKWIIKGSMQAFESAGGEAHPADVTAWTALSGATGTIDSVTRNEPRNWKHDGTILVYDNDEKILLTNLPDGQQVKIVGEGGRIEQLPPSPLPDIKRGFIISSDGNPRSSTSDGGNSVSGAYFWHEADSMFVRDDNGSSYSAYIYHDGARWNIGYQAGFGYFQSDPCASTVHPADATGWTAYDVGSGIGQGTIADGGLVKTRACEVYDSPQYETSGSTPWFTIKNTVYLTVEGWGYEFTFNGVTVPVNTTKGIGWVPVGGALVQTSGSDMEIFDVNEDSPASLSQPLFATMTENGRTTLPDVFPSGALVTIVPYNP